MIYEPKILYNPTPDQVEFMCNRQVYIFKPYEKKNLDGFVAHHALKEVNTGLIEYTDGMKTEVVKVDYEELPWSKIIKIASDKGVFRPGDSKSKVIEALKEADAKETGAVSEPTTEETE